MQVIYLKKDVQGSIPEMRLLEFQGKIEFKQETFDEGRLGALTAVGDGGKEFQLIIGIHHLTGQLKKLKKPILVTKNVLNGEGKPEIKILGVARDKIYFGKRPTPILVNPKQRAKANNVLREKNIQFA